MEYIAAIVIGIIVIMSVNKMIDWNLEQRRTTNKEYEYKYGTPLNADLIKQSIKFNGFEPMVEDNSWYVFKIQGKDYYVCYGNIPYLQFYKRFEFKGIQNFWLELRYRDKFSMKKKKGPVVGIPFTLLSCWSKFLVGFFYNVCFCIPIAMYVLFIRTYICV